MRRLLARAGEHRRGRDQNGEPGDEPAADGGSGPVEAAIRSRGSDSDDGACTAGAADEVTVQSDTVVLRHHWSGGARTTWMADVAVGAAGPSNRNRDGQNCKHERDE